MTQGDKIHQDITTAKTDVMALASKFITLSSNGELLGCRENKLIFLTNKITSMTIFANQYFDSAGNDITPIYSCPANTTLIRKYINPNYTPPNTEIIINEIDGNL